MSTEAELKKNTVPQLKAICKERGITDAWRCKTKDALIQRLLGAANPPMPTTAPPSTGQSVSTAASTSSSSQPAPPRPKKRKEPDTPSTATDDPIVPSSDDAPAANSSDNPPPKKKKKKKVETQENANADVEGGPSVPLPNDAPPVPPKKKKKKVVVEQQAADDSAGSSSVADDTFSEIPAHPEPAESSAAPPAKKKKKTAAVAPSYPAPESTIPSSSSAGQLVGEQASSATVDPPTPSSTSINISTPSNGVISPNAPPSDSVDESGVFKIPALPARVSNPVAASDNSSTSASLTNKPAAAKKKKKATSGVEPVPVESSATQDPLDEPTTTKKKKGSGDGTDKRKKKATKAPAESDNPTSAERTGSGKGKQKQGTAAASESESLKKKKYCCRPAYALGDRVSTTTKRPAASPPPSDAPVAKKSKVTSFVKPTVLPKVVMRPVELNAAASLSASRPLPPQDVARSSRLSGKRFVPLVVTKKPMATESRLVAQSTTPMPTSASVVPFYLDFPAPLAPPAMIAVTRPPKISERKRVPRLALILSFVVDYLEPQDFRGSVISCPLFRYATYISAFHNLSRNFSGARFSQVLSQYPNAASQTTNMWPYLLQRQHEVSCRKSIFNASFLGTLLSTNAISDRLWTSPDDERQLVVAIRFLLTRLFFELSGNGFDGPQEESGWKWKRGQIVDVQLLVEKEIWKITVNHGRKESEAFYVLEQTCEPLTALAEAPSSGLPIRADWSAYIAQRTSDATPLISRLSWSNHEEYERGISRVWLKRVAEEGDDGRVKLATAERYILACVVGNSLSGRWMTSIQMANEHDGRPETEAARPRAPKVNLFVPAHHHVESLHFTASGPRKGHPLHAALAIVQTPAREYFILRDNGMQVGCEEDGVAEVWKTVLRCDSWGVGV
ncbi:Abhydrolase-3 domain-containing protein [Mycena kentingensis (nom. inval.)]|nr:Abhydrolase-3 domain-containing protein [Mycena kentingensis (nom. inval.)]